MDVQVTGRGRPWDTVLTTPWGYTECVTGTGTHAGRPFVTCDIASMATKGWHVHQTEVGRPFDVRVPFHLPAFSARPTDQTAVWPFY